MPISAHMTLQATHTLNHLETSYFRRDHYELVPHGLAGAPDASSAQTTSQNDFYAELLESAADGIYGLDMNGFVTFVNPAAMRMTGWSIDDLRGRTQHSMVHHSHADGSQYPRADCPIYAALRDGQVHRRNDEVFWRKDGTSFPVAYTSAPVFRGGKPAGAVIIFRDLTEEQNR